MLATPTGNPYKDDRHRARSNIHTQPSTAIFHRIDIGSRLRSASTATATCSLVGRVFCYTPLVAAHSVNSQDEDFNEKLNTASTLHFKLHASRLEPRRLVHTTSPFPPSPPPPPFLPLPSLLPLPSPLSVSFTASMDAQPLPLCLRPRPGTTARTSTGLRPHHLLL